MSLFLRVPFFWWFEKKFKGKSTPFWGESPPPKKKRNTPMSTSCVVLWLPSGTQEVNAAFQGFATEARRAFGTLVYFSSMWVCLVLDLTPPHKKENRVACWFRFKRDTEKGVPQRRDMGADQGGHSTNGWLPLRVKQAEPGVPGKTHLRLINGSFTWDHQQANHKNVIRLAPRQLPMFILGCFGFL